MIWSIDGLTVAFRSIEVGCRKLSRGCPHVIPLATPLAPQLTDSTEIRHFQIHWRGFSWE